MARSKGEGSIKKRGKYYHLIKKVNGKVKSQSLGVTNKKDAIRKAKDLIEPVKSIQTVEDLYYFEAKAKGIISSNNLALDKVWETFENHRDRKPTSKDSLKRYQFRINQLLTWLNVNCSSLKHLSEINEKIAKDFSKWLRDRGIAHKTYNDTLNNLKALFDILRDDAGITVNPFSQKTIERLPNNPLSKKEFTLEEAQRILNGFNEIDIPCKDEYKSLFYVGAFTGARLKDCVLLKKSEVHINKNLIFVRPYKTSKHKIHVKIPIHPKLKSILEKALANIPSHEIMIFPNIAYKYLKNKKYVVEDTQNILRKFGFNSKEHIPNEIGSRIKSPCLYGFHSFRYFFVSECAKAGLPQALVMDIVGHTCPAMTKYYTRFDDKYSQKAIRSLNFDVDNDKNHIIEKINQKLANLPEIELKNILKGILEYEKNNI